MLSKPISAAIALGTLLATSSLLASPSEAGRAGLSVSRGGGADLQDPPHRDLCGGDEDQKPKPTDPQALCGEDKEGKPEKPKEPS